MKIILIEFGILLSGSQESRTMHEDRGPSPKYSFLTSLVNYMCIVPQTEGKINCAG